MEAEFIWKVKNPMVHVSLQEAQQQLPNLIDAALNGEKVIIQKDTSCQVQLVPLVEYHSLPRFGCAKGLIEMEEDFDAPLADFNEYLP